MCHYLALGIAKLAGILILFYGDIYIWSRFAQLFIREYVAYVTNQGSN